jgi:hypothetical protein
LLEFIGKHFVLEITVQLDLLQLPEVPHGCAAEPVFWDNRQGGKLELLNGSGLQE